MKEWLQRKINKRTTLPLSMAHDRELSMRQLRERFSHSPLMQDLPEAAESTEDELYKRASRFEKGVYTIEKDLGLPFVFGIESEQDLQDFLHKRLAAKLAAYFKSRQNFTKADGMSLILNPFEVKKWGKAFSEHFQSSSVADPARGRSEAEINHGAGTLVRNIFEQEEFLYYRDDFLNRLHYRGFPETQSGILFPIQQDYHRITLSENRVFAGYRERIAHNRVSATR